MGWLLYVRLQFVHLAFTVHTARTPVTTAARIDHDAFVTERVSPAVIVNGTVKTAKQVQQLYTTRIGRVSYLIYVSMRHYVLTTSGDIVLCFHTAVCFSC